MHGLVLLLGSFNFIIYICTQTTQNWGCGDSFSVFYTNIQLTQSSDIIMIIVDFAFMNYSENNYRQSQKIIGLIEYLYS